MTIRTELLTERKEAVAALRAATVCERCGAQPIEWHNEEHPENPSRRVAYMAAHGYPLERVEAEIAKCEALCRRCHMGEDGRATQARGLRAKITMEDARTIRVDPRPQSQIALDYGICRSSVSHIKTGKTWSFA